MRKVRGGADNCRGRNVDFDNATFHSSCTLIGQFKRKPLESCEKDIKKLSKLIKTLSSGNGTVRSIVMLNGLTKYYMTVLHNMYQSSLYYKHNMLIVCLQ